MDDYSSNDSDTIGEASDIDMFPDDIFINTDFANVLSSDSYEHEYDEVYQGNEECISKLNPIKENVKKKDKDHLGKNLISIIILDSIYVHTDPELENPRSLRTLNIYTFHTTGMA